MRDLIRLILRNPQWNRRWWYTQIAFNRLWRRTGWSVFWNLNCWAFEKDREVLGR